MLAGVAEARLHRRPRWPSRARSSWCSVTRCLTGIDVVAVVDEAPHRVGHLLGALGRRAGAHLVHQRDLEPLDLLLRRPLAERREGHTAQVLVPRALDHREPVAEGDRVVCHAGRESRTLAGGPAGPRNVSRSVSTFVRLLGFLRPYRAGTVWSLVLAALAMAATVAIPWLTGRGIDAVTRDDRDDLKLYAGTRRAGGARAGGAVGRAAAGVRAASRWASSSTCATACTRTCSRSSSASSRASRPAS